MTVAVPIQAKRMCPLHGEFHVVYVPNGSDVQNWRQQGLVQHVFPLLPREDRETLISGLCPEAWKVLIGEETED